MPHIEIAAEKLFYFLGLPVTNTLVASWLVIGFFVLGAALLRKRIRLIPAAFQNVVEFAVEALLGLMESVIGSREKAEKYLPLVATLFLFILVSNWFGILPGVGSIGFFNPVRSVTSSGVETRDAKETFVPLLRSAASDLNVTLALALVAVVLVNVSGMRALGVGRHLSKFLSFKNPVEFFIGILELVSEVARAISFSFRLFGNIFAGEVLLVITFFLAPYGAPIPFLMLELFVGFVQALVFAMLTTVFISLAVSRHE